MRDNWYDEIETKAEDNPGCFFIIFGAIIMLILGVLTYSTTLTPDPPVYIVLNGVRQPDKYYSCSTTGRSTGYMCYTKPKQGGHTVMFNGNILYLERAE